MARSTALFRGCAGDTKLNDRNQNMHIVFKVGCVEIRSGALIDDRIGSAVLQSGKDANWDLDVTVKRHLDLRLGSALLRDERAEPVEGTPRFFLRILEDGRELAALVFGPGIVTGGLQQHRSRTERRYPRH